jgi:hypothetical protein
MRQFQFDYSLKNIPIPSQDAYLNNLIEKVESVTKRMVSPTRIPHILSIA